MSDGSTASSAEGSDRRRTDRHGWHGRLRMSIEPARLECETDNVSSVGVLFFAQQDLRVKVEIELPDGKWREVPGRLVRFHRISAQRNGLAVEFDRAELGLPGDPTAY